MRKNAVNKELRKIAGGVCAPGGFRANGIHCGFTKDKDKKDLALIVADKRCPTACVLASDFQQSGPACATKRHIKNGLARAILVNSGIANLFLPDGERLAELACRALAGCSNIDANDTVIASTGKVGQPLSLDIYQAGLRPLVEGLTDMEEGSLFAAEAIMTTDRYPKQVAYAFDLGAFPCKIGAVYKGNTRVCPNTATTLIFLTTDVNISSEMLQKALSLTVKDTVNLLCIDGISSPNDTVCIMANGYAGNYKISCEDTEFVKFVFALKKVLGEICRSIVEDCDDEFRPLLCKISGAKSQQVARNMAKNLILTLTRENVFLKDGNGIEEMLYVLSAGGGQCDFSTVNVSLQGDEKTLVLYEEGRAFHVSQESMHCLMNGSQFCLSIVLCDGNYSAQSIGCIRIR